MDSTDFALVLDAGGFSKGYGTTALLQTEFLLQGMSMLHYDAINLSQKDFVEGGAFLQEMQKKHNLGFVSANVVYAEDKKNLVEPYLIKKVAALHSHGGLPFTELTVGIIGLCDERDSLLPKQSEEAGLLSYSTIEAARKVVPILRKKADLVILMFNGRFKVLEPLLNQVEGVDIAIVGGEYFRVEQYSGRVIAASTASMGKYFGKLTIDLDKSKTIVASQKNTLALDDNIKDDPKLAKLVADFDRAKSTNNLSSRHTNE